MSTQTFGRKQLQTQAPVHVLEVENDRKVRVLFAIGIFFLPYVFAWVLLRQGHSSTSRTLGFGWLAAVVLSAYTLPYTTNTSGAGTSALIEEPPSAWQYSTSEDAMRGTTTYFAVATASNTLHFNFPYAGGSTAQIGVVRSGDELRAGITISKGQFTCFGGNGDAVSMKFDSGSVLNFPCFRSADGNSQVIGIGDADGFFQRLRKAKKLVVEAQFFQAGYQQMTFNVEGFEW